MLLQITHLYYFTVSQVKKEITDVKLQLKIINNRGPTSLCTSGKKTNNKTLKKEKDLWFLSIKMQPNLVS